MRAWCLSVFIGAFSEDFAIVGALHKEHGDEIEEAPTAPRLPHKASELALFGPKAAG